MRHAIGLGMMMTPGVLSLIALACIDWRTTVVTVALAGAFIIGGMFLASS